MSELKIGSCVQLSDKFLPMQPKKETPKSLQTRTIEWLIGLTEEVRLLKERVKELEAKSKL